MIVLGKSKLRDSSSEEESSFLHYQVFYQLYIAVNSSRYLTGEKWRGGTQQPGTTEGHSRGRDEIREQRD